MKRSQRRPPKRFTAFELAVLAGLALGAVALILQARGVSRPSRAGLQADPPAWFDYEVVNTYPHDPDAFTQGLIYRDGFLFESTGLNGRSSLRKVDLPTGGVVQRIAIDSQYFAEGLADYDDRLIQLTWRSQVGFVYDLRTFVSERNFTYSGEGWGLARDGSRLVMSDGTSTLRFLDPETLRETGRLAVTEGSRPVERLNELELVKGQIFANIWHSDHIAMISPLTGQVEGRIDLSGLLPAADRGAGADVLNGIAYDAGHDRLLVTGKLWPRLFEIRLIRRR